MIGHIFKWHDGLSNLRDRGFILVQIVKIFNDYCANTLAHVKILDLRQWRPTACYSVGDIVELNLKDVFRYKTMTRLYEPNDILKDLL